ncbi:MAG: phosphoribosylglycinamide formyltransferase [Bacteroidales bacterium]|nr:phosphoribosylglycinamide formyltransferase [Bacteroidales bacterium]
MNKIAIFASGNGSNAENIIAYFKKHIDIQVVAVFSNRESAGVVERAKGHNVRVFIFNRHAFLHGQVGGQLRETGANFIVLAGFLWLMPGHIIEAYPGRIINVHPALLPKYGGKGMYGARVHEAVVQNRESETGITIHHVNDEYDAGGIIFQAACPVLPQDTPALVAEKVHELEHQHFPRVIERLLGQW